MENQQVEEGDLSSQDPNMQLQDDELQWAHQIKASVAADKKLDNLSDYEYAEWAIVTVPWQDVDEVLQRIYKLQYFLKQYRILQSKDKPYVLEGLDLMHSFMKVVPGYLLSIDYMESQSRYVQIVDQSAFLPSNIKTEQDWKMLLGGYFFMFQIFNSNLASTRNGVGALIECMDMGFHNFSHYVVERASSEIFEYYPAKQHESMWLNTPTAASVLLSIIRPFMSDSIKKSFFLGCKLPGYEEKIDLLFKMPTPELATEALLQKLKRYLSERHNNQQNYKLPRLPPQPDSP